VEVTGDQPLELLGMHPVIGGCPCPELAAGEGEAVAERLREPLVGLAEDADARVAEVVAKDLGDVDAGAVVDDDQFEGVMGLVEDALDRLAEQVGLAVDGEDDADQPGDERASGVAGAGGRRAEPAEGQRTPQPRDRPASPEVMRHRARERARALPRLPQHPARESPQPARSDVPSSHG
jgi:hypothetical protein